MQKETLQLDHESCHLQVFDSSHHHWTTEQKYLELLWKMMDRSLMVLAHLRSHIILQSLTARALHPLLVLATRHPSTVAMGT